MSTGVRGSRRRRGRMVHSPARFLLGLATVVALALLFPRQADAHGGLRRSTPASGARVDTIPPELKLVFTEKPELAVTRVQLLGPDGTSVALGPLQPAADSPNGVVLAVRGPLAAGTYTVAWQMTGADGHPVRGTFTFTIAPGAAGLADAGGGRPAGEAGGTVPAPGQPAPPASHHDAASMPERAGGFDAGSPGYVAVRWAQYVTLVAIIGAVAFDILVLGFVRRRAEADAAFVSAARARAAGVALWASVGLIALALLRLYAQSYAMHGPGEALSGGLAAAMVTRTIWGWGWILQVAAALAATIAFASARRGGRGWTLAVLAAVALAVAAALSGHAAASPRLTGLAVLADAAHVIGAGGWLGSLLCVLAVGIPVALRQPEAERRGPAVASLVNAFSPTALAFAGLLGATGVFAAWLHMGSIAALWRSDYGRTLLLKLGILSVLVGTGAYNWLRVKPTLGDEAGAQRVRRSATVELAIGALVLAVTAVLVAAPPPADARRMGPDPNEMAAAAATAPGVVRAPPGR